jgi:hypothetical protein
VRRTGRGRRRPDRPRPVDELDQRRRGEHALVAAGAGDEQRLVGDGHEAGVEPDRQGGVVDGGDDEQRAPGLVEGDDGPQRTRHDDDHRVGSSRGGGHGGVHRPGGHEPVDVRRAHAIPAGDRAHRQGGGVGQPLDGRVRHGDAEGRGRPRDGAVELLGQQLGARLQALVAGLADLGAAPDRRCQARDQQGDPRDEGQHPHDAHPPSSAPRSAIHRRDP